jgi:hypothetical protein
MLRITALRVLPCLSSKMCEGMPANDTMQHAWDAGTPAAAIKTLPAALLSQTA